MEEKAQTRISLRYVRLVVMCTHDAQSYTMDSSLIIQIMFDRSGQSESGGCYLPLRHCEVGCLWILTNYWPCSKRCLQKLCTPILCINNRVHLSCTWVKQLWVDKRSCNIKLCLESRLSFLFVYSEEAQFLAHGFQGLKLPVKLEDKEILDIVISKAEALQQKVNVTLALSSSFQVILDSSCMIALFL